MENEEKKDISSLIHNGTSYKLGYNDKYLGCDFLFYYKDVENLDLKESHSFFNFLRSMQANTSKLSDEQDKPKNVFKQGDLEQEFLGVFLYKATEDKNAKNILQSVVLKIETETLTITKTILDFLQDENFDQDIRYDSVIYNGIFYAVNGACLEFNEKKKKFLTKALQ